jgi:uncharacterized protein
LLHIHARPGAKTPALVGLHGGRLKVAVAAPPVDGKANDALLAFVAQQLGVARARVQLHSGAAHRDKCVRIEATDATVVVRALQERMAAGRK